MRFNWLMIRSNGPQRPNLPAADLREHTDEDASRAGRELDYIEIDTPDIPREVGLAADGMPPNINAMERSRTRALTRVRR